MSVHSVWVCAPVCVWERKGEREPQGFSPTAISVIFASCLFSHVYRCLQLEEITSPQYPALMQLLIKEVLVPKQKKALAQEHSRYLKMYSYTLTHFVSFCQCLYLCHPASSTLSSTLTFGLAPSFCFFPRLCWMQNWDQAGSISLSTGETVACQLLQMSDLQHGPHRRIHQQVSVKKENIIEQNMSHSERARSAKRTWTFSISSFSH